MKAKIILTILCFLIGSHIYSATYYLNDASTTGDLYCTAVGNNSNNGLSLQHELFMLEQMVN